MRAKGARSSAIILRAVSPGPTCADVSAAALVKRYAAYTQYPCIANRIVGAVELPLSRKAAS